MQCFQTKKTPNSETFSISSVLSFNYFLSLRIAAIIVLFYKKLLFQMTQYAMFTLDAYMSIILSTKYNIVYAKIIFFEVLYYIGNIKRYYLAYKL